jgi:hypothetical protein
VNCIGKHTRTGNAGVPSAGSSRIQTIRPDGNRFYFTAGPQPLLAGLVRFSEIVQDNRFHQIAAARLGWDEK